LLSDILFVGGVAVAVVVAAAIPCGFILRILLPIINDIEDERDRS